MKQQYDQTSIAVSRLITRKYSTSFSLGIHLLHATVRPHIYAIYGFVRLADEIVDSFEGYSQKELLEKFIADYQYAIKHGISTNPVLHAFQHVVSTYALHELVEAFLYSMQMDLSVCDYVDDKSLQKYIYGSAEVVGLMCLKVFVGKDQSLYADLKPYAVKLGSAFQKINFLRDINDDMSRLGRSYFPVIGSKGFTEKGKQEILLEIKAEFDEALKGIKRLPANCRLGVYIAYKYYINLWKKMYRQSPWQILQSRTRIHNLKKLYILKEAAIRYHINLL